MIYFVCFILSASFAWLASKSKERVEIFFWSALSILVLCLLGGLRNPFVNADVKLYAWPDFFRAQQSNSFAEFIAKRPSGEVGYLLISYLSAKIFGNISCTLFLYQLITVTCVYIGAYKQKDNISLPLLWLAFYFMPYCGSFNIMRQNMAGAIIFLGLPCLEEKKYLKFSLYILTAYTFHSSAVIAFPLILAVHVVMTSSIVNKSRLIKLLIICGAVMFMLSIEELMTRVIAESTSLGKYHVYLTYKSQYAVGWSRILTYAVALFILTVYSRRARKIIMPSKGGTAFFQAFLIINITYYAFVGLLSERILLYSDYVNLILLAALPSFIKEKHLRIVLCAGVIGVLVVYWVNFYIRKGLHQVWPYQPVNIV